MAEESDLEKTEPASPRRLEKAREEGQVVRSRELNTFLVLSAGVGTLWVMGGYLFHNLREVIQQSMWFDPNVGRDLTVMVTSAVSLALKAFLGLLPLFGVLVIVAILASVLLGGLVLSGKALQPKFERMNPLKGIKRMFSAQTLVELFKTLAKAIVIATVGVLVITHYRDQMLALMHATPSEALTYGMSLVALCCALIVAALLLVVLIDAPWQIYSHFKKLRMSRQDVKQEHKESEGDPHVKGRIRQQQRAMARGRMMSEVPHADVVVTNPTHYAVALRYREGGGGAPVVVAKGVGLIAAQIRQVASDNKVPLLSAPPLARALYHHVELEREIPVELYSAVAEVLAWVYRLRVWAPGQGMEPEPPSTLNIPSGLDPEAGKVAAQAT
ncbi:flagellar biosynthesis protein FlhB [Achromobacter sp. F4_2707]|uniref:flagellar biosynthesis protein FlhB n=1 Tax=Achromobacter sp. F4_2707 TaxID=3114286 RepID=UPI0039C6B929